MPPQTKRVTTTKERADGPAQETRYARQACVRPQVLSPPSSERETFSCPGTRSIVLRGGWCAVCFSCSLLRFFLLFLFCGCLALYLVRISLGTRERAEAAPPSAIRDGQRIPRARNRGEATTGRFPNHSSTFTLAAPPPPLSERRNTGSEKRSLRDGSDTIRRAPSLLTDARGLYDDGIRVMNKVRKTTGCCFVGVHLQRFFLFLFAAVVYVAANGGVSVVSRHFAKRTTCRSSAGSTFVEAFFSYCYRTPSPYRKSNAAY